MTPHVSLISLQQATTCMFSQYRQHSKRGKRNMLVLFSSLCLSQVSTSHWSKHVTQSSLVSLREDTIKGLCRERWHYSNVQVPFGELTPHSYTTENLLPPSLRTYTRYSYHPKYRHSNLVAQQLPVSGFCPHPIMFRFWLQCLD